MSNVIGIHSCKGCHAPLPTDRRRRYCDDCKEDAAASAAPRPEPDLDTSRAGQAAMCRCLRPLLYVDVGELRCNRCGREAERLLDAAA